MPSECRKKFLSMTVNYVASDRPLGESRGNNSDGIKRVSAGHKAHEWTSHSAIGKVFQQIDQDLTDKKDEL